MGQIHAPEGANRKKTIVGRGASSKGRTCGKGSNGQNARSGGGPRPGFEGGQMPLYRRTARRGFSNYPFNATVKELEQITGQHVVKTKARKSIANFKLREGMEIGAMVTLRGDNMWFFLERLICIALPRVKDFKGVKPNAFDGHGNYALGITEQIIFPEIDYDKIVRVSGLNVAIVTTAKTDEEGFALLKKLGMPFSK